MILVYIYIYIGREREREGKRGENIQEQTEINKLIDQFIDILIERN